MRGVLLIDKVATQSRVPCTLQIYSGNFMDDGTVAGVVTSRRQPRHSLALLNMMQGGNVAFGGAGTKSGKRKDASKSAKYSSTVTPVVNHQCEGHACISNSSFLPLVLKHVRTANNGSVSGQA